MPLDKLRKDKPIEIPTKLGPQPEDSPHPELSPEQDRLERGGDPISKPSAAPRPPHVDEGIRKRLVTLLTPHDPTKYDHELPLPKFRQDALLPYLLIRSKVGDHGIRPINWGYTSNSPDIIVVKGRVDTPGEGQQAFIFTGGQEYTIFIRVWNLGLLPAVGVTLTVSYANSFVSGETPQLATPPLGVQILNLPDCYNPGCHLLYKIDKPWTPQYDLIQALTYSTEGIVATVSCFADPMKNGADATMDRHVAWYGLDLYGD
jgi:hypothetical protein